MAESYLEGRIDAKEIFELDGRQLTFEQIKAEDIWIQSILRRSNVTKSPEASPEEQLQTRLEELRSQLESLRWKDTQREQICKAMCREILEVTALCLQETAVGQEATGQFAFARQRLESIRKLAEQVVSNSDVASNSDVLWLNPFKAEQIVSNSDVASLPAVADVLENADVLAKASAELNKKSQELDSRKRKFDEDIQKEKEQFQMEKEQQLQTMARRAQEYRKELREAKERHDLELKQALENCRNKLNVCPFDNECELKQALENCRNKLEQIRDEAKAKFVQNVRDIQTCAKYVMTDEAKAKFAQNVRNLFHTGKYVYVKYTDSIMQKALPKVFDAIGKCATTVAPDDVLALLSVRGLRIVVTYGCCHIWSASSPKHVFVMPMIPEGNQLTFDNVKLLPFSTLRCQGEKVKMFFDFFPAREAAKEFCEALAALCHLNFIGCDYVSRLNDIPLPTCFGDAPTRSKS